MKCLIDSNITSVSAWGTHHEYNVDINIPDPDPANPPIQAEVFINNPDNSSIDNLSIYTNNPDLADPNFPPENVLDEHPKKYALVNWHAAEFEIIVTDGSDFCGIAGTNAKYAIFLIFEDTTSTKPIYTYVVDMTGITSYTNLILDKGTPTSQSGVSYPYILGDHRILIRFFTNNLFEFVKVGVIQAGIASTTHFDTSRGLKEELIDYSIEKELANGAFYYKKRDVVRRFSGNIVLDRDYEFYNFMYEIFRKKGKRPLFWAVVDEDRSEWFIYARAESMPSATHDYLTKARLQFSLIEVL
jgi:hypothetical protein